MAARKTKPPGRPKGTPNAIGKALREDIYRAYHELGGRAWLVKEARKDPKGFQTIIAKILPKQTEVEHDVKEGGNVKFVMTLHKGKDDD